MRRVSQQGMTMLEVLLAAVAFGLVMYSITATMMSAIDLSDEVDKGYTRDQQVRIAMAIITNDLKHAYLSAHTVGNQNPQNVNEDNRRTIFEGETGGNVSPLRFSSLGHMRFEANANQSEQTMIIYEEGDLKLPDGSRTTALVRRATKRLPDPDRKVDRVPQTADVLVESIEEVEFRYFDPIADEWKKSWNSMREAQQGRLPSLVEVTIVVPNPFNPSKELKYMTSVKLPLQQRLDLK